MALRRLVALVALLSTLPVEGSTAQIPSVAAALESKPQKRQSVTITFVNQFETEAIVYWKNRQTRKEMQKAKVGAGNTGTVESYPGHVFVMRAGRFWQEFAVTALRGHHQMFEFTPVLHTQLEEVADSFDLDGSGFIEAEELLQLGAVRWSSLNSKNEALVQRIDTNGDGVVSKEEFAAGFHESIEGSDAESVGRIKEMRDAARYVRGGRAGAKASPTCNSSNATAASMAKPAPLRCAEPNPAHPNLEFTKFREQPWFQQINLSYPGLQLV